MAKKSGIRKWLPILLCIVLLAAAALAVTEIRAKKQAAPGQVTLIQNGGLMGKGGTSFTFTAADAEGNEATCVIKTDEKTVGAALLKLGLIAGEEGPYGLYVKTVNGKTYDYDKDGKYWAFYVNGEYGMNGVDQTEVEANAAYAFRAE